MAKVDPPHKVAPGDEMSYFKHRQVSGDAYAHYRLPVYLARRLPPNQNAQVLDFGCGFGQTVRELRRLGYANAVGFDIEPAAIDFCVANSIPVISQHQLDAKQHAGQFDLIFCSHVLEHIAKDQVIATLTKLRALLRPQGMLMVCVPNAQSNTGCYWAYEDFTHHTTYTSGSVYYVLSKAGYADIAFIDTDCTEGMGPVRRSIKRLLLAAYRANYRFWNKVTSSATHAPSPQIFSYELKAIARAG